MDLRAVLKLHRDALGVTSFSIDPYQIGYENAEAIESGAFWFYRKLGFRPTDAGVRRLLEREERRIAADPSHRSSAATLRRLVTHNLLYEIPGSPRGEWDRFHVRNLGLAVNRRMAREFDGDAREAACGVREARGAAARPAPGQAHGARACGLSGVRARARSRSGPRALEPSKRGMASRRSCGPRPAASRAATCAFLQRHARLRAALIRIGSR